MSEILGYYYLHTNKELIYKNNPDSIIDIRESDFCTAAWPFMNDREQAWTILIEAASLGADPIRIKDLSDKWGVSDNDAGNYADRCGIILGIDGNQFTAHKKDFENLQESPCGFGGTYFDAMVGLCKELGFTGGKIGWHSTFKDLCSPGFVDNSF